MFKLFAINSIRSRMVTSFLLLTFLILVLALVSFITLNRTMEVARTHSNINKLEIITLNLIQNDSHFLELETLQENYFRTHQSNFLLKRDSLNQSIEEKISELKKEEPSTLRSSLLASLNGIDSLLQQYNKVFARLEGLIYKKGFKDYGLEGAMRYNAHQLEESIPKSNIADLLYLRRHEKDFLLRHDTTYLIAFQLRAKDLLAQLNRHSQKNQQAIELLKGYSNLFLDIAAIQLEIGLNEKNSLHFVLNSLSSLISEEFYRLSEYSYKQSSIEQENARLLFVLALLGAILFSIFSAYWISKRLTEPITWLSRLVNNSIQTRTTHTVDLSLRNAADEIVVLTASFKKLIDQTRLQMNEIEKQSNLLRKRNKELKRVNQELDQFLYSSAHDMRSPLSSLLGLIHLARLDNKDEKLNPYFAMMERSVNRQEYFITQIVSFSKNKFTPLLPEKIDWQTLVSELLADHAFAPGAKDIDKQVVIHSDFDFYSDRARITIILNNLISNAIRYSDLEKPNPYMRLEITTTSSEAVLEFSDNGIGIGRDHLHKIFGMFYRAHSHSKGSGLGLFILYKTVRRMRGTVIVKSEEKIGTTFIIKLPMLALYPVAVNTPEQRAVMD
ncbi:MAG: HAMP domain-containing histidine kinase [Cyclobacteriaceae bacterium]|nr:HAMP domain-containing histidine kinase [Cyclobacteriaceae bacterium]